MANLKDLIERREREAAALRALAELEPEVAGWLEEDRRLEQEETLLRRRADEALARLREHRRAAEAWRATVRERLAATGATQAIITAHLGLPSRLARPPVHGESEGSGEESEGTVLNLEEEVSEASELEDAEP
jgi:hypothetical protein